MTLIDMHTHFFSAVFFKTLAEQSPRPGTPAEKLAAFARKTGVLVPSDDVAEHTARWIAEMERRHIAHLVAFASVPEEIPAVCQAAALSHGRISAMALVNPKVEGVADKVRALLEQKKVRGVLVFPAMHHYRIDGPEAKPLLAVLNEHKALIYVHCGLLVVKLRDLLGLPRPQNLEYANPLPIVPAANAHPDVAFVIPHFGAGFFREALMAGAQCENVHVDTSSSNSWIATQCPKPSLREVFERALEVFGPERILFGTDSNTFPTGWRNDRYEEQHEALTVSGATTSAQELIFAGNARRLLRIA